MYDKREHGEWHKVMLASDNRSFTANHLRCGTLYTFHIRAFNRVGEGTPSDTISAVTNGSGKA